MPPGFVGRGQADPVRCGVDQQVMFVQGRDQARQPTGGHPCGGGQGIQGGQIQAPVQTLRHGDLGITEPVQDDPGVGA
jgi:hypothetical protein